MALDPISLLTPKGPVTLGVLGSAGQRAIDSGEAKSLLEQYVAAAYQDDEIAALTAGTARDKGARIFSLWRIYADALQGMIDRPASVKVDEKGSHAYTDKQLAAMQAIVDDYRKKLDDVLTPAEIPPDDAVEKPAFVPTFVCW